MKWPSELYDCWSLALKSLTYCSFKSLVHVSKIRCPSVTYPSIVCFCFLSLRSRKMWSNIVTMFCSFTAFSYYILFCSWPQKGVRGNRWNNCWRRPRAAGVTRYVTYLPISVWAVVMWFTYLYPFMDQVNYLYLGKDKVNYFPIDVQWRGIILTTYIWARTR